MAKTKTKSTTTEPHWDSGNTVYTQDNIAKLSAARDTIAEALRWDDTKEGYEYWSGVFDNLDRVVNELSTRIRGGYDSRL
jgi:hypothetical protein